MSVYRPCLLCGELHVASPEYDESEDYYCPNVHGPNSAIALDILTRLWGSVAKWHYGEDSTYGWHWAMIVCHNPPRQVGEGMDPKNALRQAIAVLRPYTGDARASYLADRIRNNLRALSLRAERDKGAQIIAREAREALDSLMGWPAGTSGKGYE